MAQYGEILIDNTPETDSIYQYFDDYFNHPNLVKVKNVDTYSVYMCKMYCLLSNQCRYIIAFIDNDGQPLDTKQPLKALEWKSFQTRTLSDNHKLPNHGYQPNRSSALNKAITRTDISDEASTYKCAALSLVVTLLHKNNDKNQYKNDGNVLTALETYQTIITLA